jgi:hypothetical protein
MYRIPFGVHCFDPVICAGKGGEPQIAQEKGDILWRPLLCGGNRYIDDVDRPESYIDMCNQGSIIPVHARLCALSRADATLCNLLHTPLETESS